MDIEFDQWYQDIIDPDTGKVLHKDVLFIRGRKGMIEFHCPIYDVHPAVDVVQDVKDLITLKINAVAED
jgi:hypothetical protein